MPNRALPLLVLFILLLATGRAGAQDSATAEVLFKEGRRLMQEGQYDSACPKLAESQRLDPGVGTALNLADCYEKAGRTASAWAVWLDAATLARHSGQEEREGLARARARDLEPQLVRLRVDVPPGSRLPGLEITRNGHAIVEASWDIPLPVDPGPYVVLAQAPGHQPWQLEVHVPPGTHAVHVTVPQLQPEGATGPAPGTPAAAPPVGPGAPADPPPEPADDGSSQHLLGAIVAGVGLVGLVVGTVFALKAMSLNDDSLRECPNDDNLCTPRGVALRDDARSAGNVATAGFAVGIAGVAVGGSLYLLAPDGPRGGAAMQTAPGRRAFGFRLGGAF
jgi:hypothetical protein